MEELEQAWLSLTGSINDDQSLLNLQGQFDDVKTAAEESWKAASEGADDAEKRGPDHALAFDDLKLKVIDHGREVLGLPPEQATKMLAEIDEGSLAAIESRLNLLARNRSVSINGLLTAG